MKIPENLEEFIKYKQECKAIAVKITLLGEAASRARRRLSINELRKNIIPLRKRIKDIDEEIRLARTHQLFLDNLLPDCKRRYLPVLKLDSGTQVEFKTYIILGNALVARNAALAKNLYAGTLKRDSVFCERLELRKVGATRSFKVKRKGPRPVGTCAGIKRKKIPNVLVGQ